MEGQNGAQNLDTKGNGVQKEWSKDGKAEISVIRKQTGQTIRYAAFSVET